MWKLNSNHSTFPQRNRLLEGNLAIILQEGKIYPKWLFSLKHSLDLDDLHHHYSFILNQCLIFLMVNVCVVFAKSCEPSLVSIFKSTMFRQPHWGHFSGFYREHSEFFNFYNPYVTTREFYIYFDHIPYNICWTLARRPFSPGEVRFCLLARKTQKFALEAKKKPTLISCWYKYRCLTQALFKITDRATKERNLFQYKRLETLNTFEFTLILASGYWYSQNVLK